MTAIRLLLLLLLLLCVGTQAFVVVPHSQPRTLSPLFSSQGGGENEPPLTTSESAFVALDDDEAEEDDDDDDVLEKVELFGKGAAKVTYIFVLIYIHYIYHV